MLQNATPLRKSAPGLPNSSDEHVSCTAPATENASLQILFKCPTPAIVLEMLQNPHVLLTFDNVRNPLRLPRKTTSERPKVLRTPLFFALLTSKCLSATTACTFSASQLPKVVRTWFVLYILTSKCASRHNRVHFFDIATSKSAPNVRCFSFFTCKCASRHNDVHLFDSATSKSVPELRCFVHFDLEMRFAPHDVQFFISHLASWLRTRRFSEPTF